MTPERTVVAAIIERNGDILICQRRHDDRYPMKWEFPGGKAEAGEAPRAALERELDEELSIRATIGPEVTRYEYQYAARTPILLIFYRVTEFEGEPENRVFEQIRWETPRKLAEYDFVDGDVEFVKKLAGGMT